VIGTDSLASNHQLSIAAELKTIRQHFPHIESAELLRWSTFNGARALGLDHILGSFEKGKEPGVLTIQEDFSVVNRLI
jgi:imidazolonepropionase-like amidohydrolase